MTEDTTLDAAARTDAAGTYRFTPDGYPCVSCGTPVTRLWRGDDGLRCGDCASWS